MIDAGRVSDPSEVPGGDAIDGERVLDARRPELRDDGELGARSDLGGDRRTLLGLAAATAIVCAVALMAGAVSISPAEMLGVLGSWTGLVDGAPLDRAAVVTFIRLPRIALGLGCGAALASAGALMQGLFRNPLADPGLVGTSAGAALGGAFAIVVLDRLGAASALGAFALPVAAFLGASGAAHLLERLARSDGHTSPSALLLAGIAVNALALAGVGVLASIATDQQLRTLSFWSLGSLGQATWPLVAIVTPLFALPIALSIRHARDLDALLLGECEASQLGLDVERLSRRLVTLTSALVGAAVASAGVIGFVGLITPHIVRLVRGPGHATLLPASALLGGALLVAADTVARTIVQPSELPLGTVTALIGAPFFLWLMRRERTWELG